MSFDYNSSRHPCDHQVLMERYVVGPDLRTLQLKSNPAQCMAAPVNGAKFVRVYIGGSLVSAEDSTYGYSVVRDPTRIDQAVSSIFYKIVFRRPVRITANVLIEVSYITQAPFCPKCAGNNSNTDWVVGGNGQVARVTGTRKMAQQCLKYILSSRIPFNRELECALRTYVGHKMDTSITEEGVSSEVARVLSVYKQIQAAQQTVQVLEATEVLKDITNVAVREDPDSPTQLYVTVQVQGYGGSSPVPLNISLQAN